MRCNTSQNLRKHFAQVAYSVYPYGPHFLAKQLNGLIEILLMSRCGCLNCTSRYGLNWWPLDIILLRLLRHWRSLTSVLTHLYPFQDRIQVPPGFRRLRRFMFPEGHPELGQLLKLLLSLFHLLFYVDFLVQSSDRLFVPKLAWGSEFNCLIT